MTFLDHRLQHRAEVSTALYAFAAWLTTREDRTIASRRDNADGMAEAIYAFCRFNGLPDPDFKVFSFYAAPNEEFLKSVHARPYANPSAKLPHNPKSIDPDYAFQFPGVTKAPPATYRDENTGEFKMERRSADRKTFLNDLTVTDAGAQAVANAFERQTANLPQAPESFAAPRKSTTLLALLAMTPEERGVAMQAVADFASEVFDLTIEGRSMIP